MNPEDLLWPGTYIDTVTGDIWEKHEDGKWFVNGMPHKPFPLSLVPEQEGKAELAASEYRPIPGFPQYEVNRRGRVRYVETHTAMAPSQGNDVDSYYPFLDDERVVRMMPLSVILDRTFPESSD